MKPTDSSRGENCVPYEIISEFVRGKLNSEAESDLIKHLSVCEHCTLEARAEMWIREFFEKETHPRDYVSLFEKEMIKDIKDTLYNTNREYVRLPETKS